MPDGSDMERESASFLLLLLRMLTATAYAALICFICIGTARAQDVTCEDAFAKLEAAIAARDRGQLEYWGVEANNIYDCDANLRTRLRRSAARILAGLVQDAQRLGEAPAEIQRRLGLARRVSPVWEVLVLIGDQAFARKDYASAGREYNLALNDMALRFPGDPPVPETRVVGLHRRASETDMLAPGIPTPMRNGFPGGVDAVLLPGGGRDLAVVPRMLPVTFEYAKATMTREGTVFADNWVRTLRGIDVPVLILAGHTDPTGDRHINEELSVRRALAVADFMRGSGYQGRLIVVGFGQRCAELRFTADYTEDQKNQIRRRVEVLRGDQLPAGYCDGQAPRRLAG